MGSSLFQLAPEGVLEWVLLLAVGWSGLCIVALVPVLLVSWCLEADKLPGRHQVADAGRLPAARLTSDTDDKALAR
jgi:hypothetical protein